MTVFPEKPSQILRSQFNNDVDFCPVRFNEATKTFCYGFLTNRKLTGSHSSNQKFVYFTLFKPIIG